ncbi:MAG: hypothetical protein IPJ71_08165 [Bdellovibrionales bacterium]|nr:hypothetical protein [Bdellovibrionales bacterium]
MTAQDKPWLVKSGGRVVGPYSKQQVEQLLRSREISVMDEVSQPCRRWNCAKDVPFFAKVIEEVRVQNFKFGEDTVTTAIEGTGTITVTEPVDGAVLDDRTDDLNKFQRSRAEIVYEDIDDGSRPSSQAGGSQPYKSFGYQNDMVIANQARATARLAWLVTGAILFGIGTFVFYNRFVAVPFQNRETATDVKRLAMESLVVGDYAEAMEGFQKAYRLDPRDGDIYAYLGTLQIQVAGQTVVGRRKLQEVISSGRGVFPKLAMTAIGIADLIDGDSISADDKFKQVLALDPYYAPAKINLGASALQRREFKIAREWLSSVVDQGIDEGAAYLMLAEADINLYREEKDPSYLEHAQKQLTRLMQKSFDYFQEAALMLGYIDFIAGRNEQLEQKLGLILDIDPMQTEDHRHDLFVYRGRVSWKSLHQLCLQMVGGLTPSPRVKALRGYCYFRGGQEVEALKSVDDAAAQGVKDALVQSLYAFILDGIGQETRASVALGKATELNASIRLALPMILQGRFYARAGKHKMALELWQSLYRADEKSLVGLAGLAEAHFSLKNYSEAQGYLVEGFRLSKDYRPLYRVKKRAEREGLMPKGSF